MCGVKKEELPATRENKIVKTYSGVEEISVTKPEEKIKIKNGALITIQKVRKKTHGEARIKYLNELIGHPFFISLKEKRASIEIRRKYGVKDSVLVKVSEKKQKDIKDKR